MSFKIYHLSDLNEDTQEFLKMPKRPYKEKDSYNWPNPGEKLQIELISESNKSLKFFLDIYESRKSSSIVVGVINDRKPTYQSRVSDRQLLRVDLCSNPEILRHRNPDGELVVGNHIHLDVPEFGSKFAVPLAQQDVISGRDEDFISYFESLLDVYSISDSVLTFKYKLGV